jgi:hypothetical protein
MSANREALRQITDQILTGDNFGVLRAACGELYQLFSQLTGIAEDSVGDADARQSVLACGKAISPQDAARCVVDFARTVAFLRGVNTAIMELKRRFPGERLEVLYAGCGPFAPLLAPLLDRYAPDDLRVTLLDIHQRSLDAATTVIRELGLASFINRCELADASTYQHGTRPHLIICEMLQQALKTEPQVAVTANLAPQVIDGGNFIPECITVEACLVDARKELGLDGAAPDRINLGTLIELDATSIQTGSPISLTPVTVEIPPVEVERYQLLLLTKIRVFDTIVLNDRDSGITCPTPLGKLPVLAPGDRIEFTYVTGSNPHFEYRLTPAPDLRLPALF